MKDNFRKRTKNDTFPKDDDSNSDLQKKKILEKLRKLNCSENIDKEAVQKQINDDLKLGNYKVWSDSDALMLVTRGWKLMNAL